jgi:hypothetical protein
VNEKAVGFLILGIGILAVLAVVFAVTVRSAGPAHPRPKPPPGVHLPPPSWLPVILSIGAALIGAGLIFKPDEPYALPVIDFISGTMQPLLGLPGIAVLLYGVWGWVRAAGHEWHETEAGGGHDGPGH